MNDNERKAGISQRLREAASMHAEVLRAVVDDASRCLGAMADGRFRQVSGNSVELHNSFGALDAIRTLAADYLTREEIRAITRDAFEGAAGRVGQK